MRRKRSGFLAPRGSAIAAVARLLNEPKHKINRPLKGSPKRADAKLRDFSKGKSDV